MRKEDLHDALNQLDDKIVQDVISVRVIKKRRPWILWLVVAVLLVAGVFGIGSYIRNSFLERESSSLVEKESLTISDSLSTTVLESKTSIKEVVFLNEYVINGIGLEDGLTSNYLYSSYIVEEEDTLYAFYVYLGRYVGDNYEENRDREDYISIVVERMKKAGLLVLSDYPYCEYNQEYVEIKPNYTGRFEIGGWCAVAGTLEDIKRVFDGGPPIDGWTFLALSAPRPDLEEFMEKVGWDKSGGDDRYPVSACDWYFEREYLLRPFIGNRYQVTLPVEVDNY